MRTLICVLNISILFLCAGINASETHHVPDDFLTIQEAIDAATTEDTIVVAAGTYYENLNIFNKTVYLVSNYSYTGDTSYISSTVIDGSYSNRVIYAFEGYKPNNSIIDGFTIQHGSNMAGAGIYSYKADITIKNNIIKENYASGFWYYSGAGGGILTEECTPVIQNNIIINNSASGWWYSGIGGGIYCFSSNAAVFNNLIVANSPEGIILDNSIGRILNNTICSNYPGLSSYNSEFTISNCIIKYNYNDYGALDIYDYGYSNIGVEYSNISSDWPGPGNINQDPLFINTTDLNYNLCGQSPCIDTGDPILTDPDGTRSDMGRYYDAHPNCSFGNRYYVAEDGDDEIGDGSEENPFSSIQRAVDQCLSGDTIIVKRGTYRGNINITAKNIILASEFLFSQDRDDIHNTIIKEDNSYGYIINIYYCEDLMELTGFSIDPDSGGNSIRFNYSNCKINNNIIINGNVGISCNNSSTEISKCIIYDNSSTGMDINNSDAQVFNNIVFFNKGPGVNLWQVNGDVYNNIIRLNRHYDLQLSNYDNNECHVSYNNINGGYDGVGNIDVAPLFVNASSLEFNLCGQSQCIDAGVPDINDPDGTRSDIGIYFPDHPTCQIQSLWHVSEDGDDKMGNGTEHYPFRTITNTYNFIRDNDTILVHPGNYSENITIDLLNVTLASNYIFSLDTNDIVTTVIDGDSSGSVISISNCQGNTRIIGLTITNGYNNYGGGINLNHSNSIIKNNILQNNRANILGGGLWAEYCNIIIESNIVKENVANFGGGIGIRDCDSSAIDNNHIMNNSAITPPYSDYYYWARGGAIHINYSTVEVNSNLIARNYSDHYAAAICTYSGIKLYGNTIYGNKSRKWGAAIAIYGGQPSISNNIMAFNKSDGGQCVYIKDETSIPFISCTAIYGNMPTNWGTLIEEQQNINGNISTDPLFCDTTGLDFAISGNSPCQPWNSVCACQIGLCSIGCDLFTTGDMNGDWIINLIDVIFLINYVYEDGPPPLYEEAADMNYDGNINITDIMFLIALVYR